MFKNKKDLQKKEAIQVLEKLMAQKIDNIFAPLILKFNQFFNRLNRREKAILLLVIFSVLILLTFNQWKQIAT
jgi:hypothetical protein